jgi:hypothetical protein
VAIEQLKDDSVIVFINGLDLYESSELVQEAFTTGPALGSPLPIVASFDAGLTKVLGVLDYDSMKDKSGFPAVKKALSKLGGNDADKKTQTNRLPEMWKDNSGRTLRATYVNSTGEDVTLRLKNGEVSTLKLSLLSEASQKRVTELAQLID